MALTASSFPSPRQTFLPSTPLWRRSSLRRRPRSRLSAARRPLPLTVSRRFLLATSAARMMLPTRSNTMLRRSVCSAPSSCLWMLPSFRLRRSSSRRIVRLPPLSRALPSSSARLMWAATRRSPISIWRRRRIPLWAIAPFATALITPTSTRCSFALCCAPAPLVTSRL